MFKHILKCDWMMFDMFVFVVIVVKQPVLGCWGRDLVSVVLHLNIYTYLDLYIYIYTLYACIDSIHIDMYFFVFDIARRLRGMPNKNASDNFS